MVGAWWAWLVAIAMYALFRLWYDNWRGPVSRQEIETFMTVITDSRMSAYSDPHVIRDFLENDDGKEFVMVNLVRVHPTEVDHPHTGKPTKAAISICPVMTAVCWPVDLTPAFHVAWSRALHKAAMM